MVNWHDPALLLKEYRAASNLNHAVAGIYFWETVFTASFEFNVLRRKRSYKWTIWLYLGTRYTGLLAFLLFLINVDGPGIPCQPLAIATLAMGYACWAFASLIIVVRVIAIWNCNTIVSLISVGVWSGGLALHIRNLTMVSVTYDSSLDACTFQHTRRSLVNAIGALVVDTVLLLTMLIGLLRHSLMNSSGLWKLLYQQCIIWFALALFAEIPVVVFLVLDLNDVWNEIVAGPAIAILSIGAARMYRSLSNRGSLSEYESPDLPQFQSGTSNLTAQRSRPNILGPMQFASVTPSSGAWSMCEAPVFIRADQIQAEFIPE